MWGVKATCKALGREDVSPGRGKSRGRDVLVTPRPISPSAQAEQHTHEID